MKTTRLILPVPALVIKTSRLLLRPIQQSDLTDFHALRTQKDVMIWTSSGVPDINEDATQIWMNRFLPPNDATTFVFAIEELDAPGRVIGSCGCHDVNPPEVGYMFRTESWGRGYATEAMQSWLQLWWSLPRQEIDLSVNNADTADVGGVALEVLKADAMLANYASRRILEKYGFILVHEEMVDEPDGSKVMLLTFELQRPQ